MDNFVSVIYFIFKVWDVDEGKQICKVTNSPDDSLTCAAWHKVCSNCNTNFKYLYLFIYLYINLFIKQHLLPPPCVRHASCHEISESRRLVKLKDIKKEISPFMLSSCRPGQRQTSTLTGFYKAVASHQSQGFIPQATPHAFPCTNYHHTLLSCTILLACLASKPPFFK